MSTSRTSTWPAGRCARRSAPARLDDAVAVETASQILEGLAHAHAQGIVHRDVKPSNVLLADGPEISVRLLDFGLAQIEEAETLTAVGDVPGTLAYISPERLEGASGTAGGRRLGGRRRALGVARRVPPVLDVLAARDREGDRGRRAAARTPCGPICRRRSGRRRPRARRRSGPAAERLASSRQRAPRHAHDAPEAGKDALRSAARRRTVRLKVPAMAPRLAALAGSPRSPRPPGATLLPFYPGELRGGARRAGCGARVRPATRSGCRRARGADLPPRQRLARPRSCSTPRSPRVWVALMWKEPLGGLLFALGPLLAPIGALGLLPLAVQGLKTPWRRALQTAVGVLVAAVVAGLRQSPLPFTGAAPPLGLGIAESNRPTVVAGALWRALQAQSGRRNRGARARRRRSRDPVRPRARPLGDRRARRRDDRANAPARAHRCRAATRARRLGHLCGADAAAL